MAFVVKRGNPDYFAGEALVYAKCSENGRNFLPGIFVATDDFRVRQFGDEYTVVRPIKEFGGAFFKTKCERDYEIVGADSLNTLKAGLFAREDVADIACITTACEYLSVFYRQVKNYCGIDFSWAIDDSSDKKKFSKRLDFLVEKMLTGFEHILDPPKYTSLPRKHQAEASASLIRLLCAKVSGCYSDAVLISEWAGAVNRRFKQRKGIVLMLADKIKAIAGEEYKKASELRDLLNGLSKEES